MSIESLSKHHDGFRVPYERAHKDALAIFLINLILNGLLYFLIFRWAAHNIQTGKCPFASILRTVCP